MKPQVVIVEDDPEIAKLLKKQLVRLDFDVVEASDGEKALEKISATVPALICLDVMLPNISGYDVCEKIRRDPALANVPILMISARSLPMDRARAFELGANAFLPKPFSSKDLAQLVKNLVARAT